jgi:type III restriction enzyme
MPMELKRYQEQVLRNVRVYLDALSAHQSAGNKHASLDAWETVKDAIGAVGNYQERKNGLQKDLPTFCIKVPTGGGKTLQATQILGTIYQTILKSRNGAGLVLWVVPSDQIYKDTLKALRDRRHFYRVSLEFALSRQIEVWEKNEIARLTPGQLLTNLNILLLMLPSTNREVREQLKFFRDSGGNIVQHFPPEDEPDKHKQLKERIPNLDMVVEDPSQGEYLAKTSLGNLVRLCEPAVILDEGHKATSDLARQTIEGFNAAIVVELSATPHRGANVLVRVDGMELLQEEMIKLPINIANSNQKDWKQCLSQARDKREELKRLAARHYQETGTYIRPIVLVQVERTGKEQRGQKFVHSEDAKKHLMERLGVPEDAIAIKSSEKDDIEGLELLDDGCPIEWIITRAALQEGWDCPFAYILVSLNNTASQQAMTQLVGRVLRQPFVTKTPYEELNQSYVFCLRKKAEEISREVKKALEKEGYEGEAASVVDRSGPEQQQRPTRETRIRPEFRRLYKRPFEGKIYLPRFCVKNGNGYEGLDYYRHLLSKVDVDEFNYRSISWPLMDEANLAKDTYYQMTLGQEGFERIGDLPTEIVDTDDQVRRWLVANLPFEYFSQKQLRAVVEKVLDRVLKSNPALLGKMAQIKYPILGRTRAFIEEETNRQTEAAFAKLFESKKLCFFLECQECRFEIPDKIEVRALKPLMHTDYQHVERSLFDYTENNLNDYEKSVALYLDRNPEVLWWYRNMVGPENFSIQGYRRALIYPDFVVQQGRNKKPIPRVMVVESKGKHLQGNPDTEYKRRVAEYFEKIGKKVTWQELGEGFQDHQFRFQILDEGEQGDQSWKDELKQLLEESAT